MTYWLKALAARPEQEQFSHWAWADHDGWHTATCPPAADPVPTGQVCAWGPDTWAFWREDPRAGVRGAVLHRAERCPGDGWHKAQLDDVDQRKATMVSGAEKQKTHGEAPGEIDLHQLRPRVLTVSAPARLSFLELAAA